MTQLVAISPIDWFAMATGILGVYLSIKEKILAWPLFILCYTAYVYISFRGHYYAFGGMNLIFIGVAGYGWYRWAASAEQADQQISVSRLAPRHRLKLAAFIVTGTLGIGYLLSITGEARLPYFDAFATSCALCAQWMLSRKHIENWLFWMVADCVYLVFFFNDQIWPSVILFAVFIFLAVKGWCEWRTQLEPAPHPPTA